MSDDPLVLLYFEVLEITTFASLQLGIGQVLKSQ